IVRGQGNYLLAVKENQSALYQKVKALLDEAVLEGFKNMSHDRYQSVDGDHGRIETRTVWVSDEVKWLGEELQGKWSGLSSIVAVQCQREDLASGKSSSERRYYISSIKGASAKAMAQAVRGHWSVENRLHW